VKSTDTSSKRSQNLRRKSLRARLTGKRYKSYAEHFLSPVVLAKRYVGETTRNMRTFLAGDFHMKFGMKYLIEAFYLSIAEGAPLPIPYRQIVFTARIMDDILDQFRGAESLEHATSRRFL